jgi:hypothetical protein
MEISGQCHAPSKREGAPSTPLIEGWVSPKDGLDAVAKRNICCIADVTMTQFLELSSVIPFTPDVTVTPS